MDIDDRSMLYIMFIINPSIKNFISFSGEGGGGEGGGEELGKVKGFPVFPLLRKLCMMMFALCSFCKKKMHRHTIRGDRSIQHGFCFIFISDSARF